MKWTIGIDEVGRGPLAGPVAVGVVKTPGNFDWASKLPGVTDSKKLSEKKRETISALATKLREAGELDFAVVQIAPNQIDKHGISWAIRSALARGLVRVAADHTTSQVLLDGSLKAPKEFQQETIIKGDLHEPAIGLASIMAKVARDQYMQQKGQEAAFAAYGFPSHKGYGTKAHREAIAKHGLSTLHRRTYCRNIKVL